jgi:2-aminoadipate transaminase
MTAEFAKDFREGYDINLGVGYVNDQTIPTEVIGKAYQSIINSPGKYRNALNYGGAEGSPNLHQSIRNYYLNNQIGGIPADELNRRRIVIGANGATSLLDAFSDILKPGVVITADPFYYIYTETLESKGYKVVTVTEDQYGIMPEHIENIIADYGEINISFFYIVTVNNPSSVILSNKRRKQIVDIASRLSLKTKRKIPVIFDKAYEDIIHDESVEKPISGLIHDEHKIAFEIGTLSKIFAPALRIGYAICPDDEIAGLLIQRTSDIGFSAPLINQEIASWLLDNYIQIQKKEVNQGYREKARFVENLFHEHLGPYLEDYRGGQAAFYFYLTLKGIKTDKNSNFRKFLSRTTGDPDVDGTPEKKERLIYIPGEICSKKKSSPYQLRISYGFEAQETFERAIRLIKSACKYAQSKK